MPCHSCGFQGLVITCCFSHVSKSWITVSCHFLWIPGPHHYLLFNHVSNLWIGVSCHSCGFQDLVITCYLATLVNCGLPVYHHGLWVFSCVSFVTSSCHEFLLYILVTTIEVVNCFSAYGLSQVCSFTW